MEGFKLLLKPNTPNTFLLTYNDKVVERQRNDLNWVQFETTDAYRLAFRGEADFFIYQHLYLISYHQKYIINQTYVR